MIELSFRSKVTAGSTAFNFRCSFMYDGNILKRATYVEGHSKVITPTENQLKAINSFIDNISKQGNLQKVMDLILDESIYATDISLKFTEHSPIDEGDFKVASITVDCLIMDKMFVFCPQTLSVKLDPARKEHNILYLQCLIKIAKFINKQVNKK